MTLQTEKFIRKVRPVEAVKVTEENLSQIAGWSRGLVVPAGAIGNAKETYVHVPVANARRDSDSQAFVGMWVIKEDFNRFRVLSNKHFKNTYDAFGKSASNGKTPVTPAAMPKKQPQATPAEDAAVAVVPTPTDLHQERLDQVEANNQKEETVDSTEFNHDALGENELDQPTGEVRDLEQAESDQEAEQLPQPNSAPSLCGSCGSPVVDGVCSSDIDHDILGQAPQEETSPRILPGN